MERDKLKMGKKTEKKKMEQLTKMILEKDPDETVEQVLVKFCAQSGVSLDTCRIYYQFLVTKGDIKET